MNEMSIAQKKLQVNGLLFLFRFTERAARDRTALFEFCSNGIDYSMGA